MFARTTGTTTSLLTVSALLIVLLSGCGNESYLRKKNRSYSQAGNDSTLPIETEENVDSGTSNGTPAYSYRVGAVGYTSTTVTVRARNVLKVRFTPGVQDEKIPGTGYSPIYSALGVYIKVGSLEEPTPLLSNGLYDGKAEGHDLNFSGAFSRTCQSSDTDCRETITITISKPNNNFACLAGYYAYCPYSRVFDNHPWHGTLLVETDDTDPLPAQ